MNNEEYKFNTYDITGYDIDGIEDPKNLFNGVAAVEDKVVFAPSEANVGGVFDVATNTFSTFDISEDLTGVSKFQGAAAVGTKGVFAPGGTGGYIGVFDVATNTFSGEGKDILWFDEGYSLAGAAAVGSKVIFCPFHQHGGKNTSIFVFDVDTNEVSTIENLLPIYNYEFYGAVAVGDKVVFVPSWGQPENKKTYIGIFDVTTSEFSNFDISSFFSDDQLIKMRYKFRGAAVVGTKVVFAPNNFNSVGVFDVEIGEFATYPTYMGSDKELFNGAAAYGDTVVFSPYNASGIGLFNTNTKIFTLINNYGPENFSDFFEEKELFSGAVAVGNRIVFCPFKSKFVGVLDLPVENDEEKPNLALILGLALGLGIPILIIIIVLIVKDPANVIYKNK